MADAALAVKDHHHHLGEVKVAAGQIPFPPQLLFGIFGNGTQPGLALIDVLMRVGRANLLDDQLNLTLVVTYGQTEDLQMAETWMDLLPYQGLAAGEDFLDMAAVAAAVLVWIKELETARQVLRTPLSTHVIKEVHVVIEDALVTVYDRDQAGAVGKKLF